MMEVTSLFTSAGFVASLNHHHLLFSVHCLCHSPPLTGILTIQMKYLCIIYQANTRRNCLNKTWQHQQYCNHFMSLNYNLLQSQLCMLWRVGGRKLSVRPIGPQKVSFEAYGMLRCSVGRINLNAAKR